jgi:hypothetical protein
VKQKSASTPSLSAGQVLLVRSHARKDAFGVMKQAQEERKLFEQQQQQQQHQLSFSWNSYHTSATNSASEHFGHHLYHDNQQQNNNKRGHPQRQKSSLKKSYNKSNSQSANLTAQLNTISNSRLGSFNSSMGISREFFKPQRLDSERLKTAATRDTEESRHRTATSSNRASQSWASFDSFDDPNSYEISRNFSMPNLKD